MRLYLYVCVYGSFNKFLESIKVEQDCPFYGFQLAKGSVSDQGIVRHFGLGLLEYSIKYDFPNYDKAQRLAIRNWIVELALSGSDNDAHYIKEKIAFLWVSLAKRTWGSENEKDGDGWCNMDSILLEMWNTSSETKALSIMIFKTLFEDMFILDDPVASKRASVLSAQCIELVTSEEDLHATYESRVDSLQRLRSDPSGWLIRWSNLLGECLHSGLKDSKSESFAVKILETFKGCLHWALPLAIRSSNLLERLSVALTTDNIRVKILATDCLHLLFTRSFNSDDDFQAIVGSVFLPSGISTLAQVYDSIKMDIDHFDEQNYVFLKKLVEMIVGLGEYLNISKNNLPDNADLGGFLRLVLKTTQHESLVISGLSLQFWCSVLRVDKIHGRDEVTKLLADLLHISAERCIRYEDLGEDHVMSQFLALDFDSTPDSHIFLGNYRHFMEDIVRLIVCEVPFDSLNWIRSRMNAFFASEIGWSALNLQKLEYENNPNFYLCYSQFILVEVALRGVTRWKLWYQQDDKEQLLSTLMVIVEEWCKEILMMQIKDPVLLRKLVQSLVQFAPLLKGSESSQLMFMVLERILTACTTEYPDDASDEDREIIRDLRTSCGTELNRLAYLIPDSLMGIYPDLERVIGEIVSTNKISDHEIVAFQSFLLVISQRCTNIDTQQKAEKFASIVDPVLSSWLEESTVKGLMDLPWFMERIGIVKIAEYFRSRGVTDQTDLFSTNMDDVGRALKAELKEKWSKLFPIRATRIFIQYTIEKLNHQSAEYQALLELWKPRIQPIIPHILQLIAQIEAYHNPSNWSDLPPEVQSFVKYSCLERFWQMGVSIQTRDEFVDENVRAMNTLRDFADSTGHIIRYTREYAFLTLGSISQLDDTLYSRPNIVNDLWAALANDSQGITSHCWRHMISLVLRNIVKNCPRHLVQPFMIEFLPLVLTKLNEVLNEKWSKVYSSGLQIMDGEEITDDSNLSDEMMEEHLLRQLTAIVDRFLIDLVGQAGHGRANDVVQGTTNSTSNQPYLKETVLRNKVILAPFLKLCMDIMLFKDNRCSFNACLVIRNIMGEILLKDNEVDEFLCDYYLKACLTILSDRYFMDVHNEAAYILTTVYTTLRTKDRRPYETLLMLIPNADENLLDDVESQISVNKSLRQQRGVFLDFLALTRVTQSDNHNDLYVRDQKIKHLQKKIKEFKDKKFMTHKRTEGTNLIEEEGLDASLATLYGGNDNN